MRLTPINQPESDTLDHVICLGLLLWQLNQEGNKLNTNEIKLLSKTKAILLDMFNDQSTYIPPDIDAAVRAILGIKKNPWIPKTPTSLTTYTRRHAQDEAKDDSTASNMVQPLDFFYSNNRLTTLYSILRNREFTSHEWSSTGHDQAANIIKSIYQRAIDSSKQRLRQCYEQLTLLAKHINKISKSVIGESLRTTDFRNGIILGLHNIAYNLKKQRKLPFAIAAETYYLAVQFKNKPYLEAIWFPFLFPSKTYTEILNLIFVSENAQRYIIEKVVNSSHSNDAGQFHKIHIHPSLTWPRQNVSKEQLALFIQNCKDLFDETYTQHPILFQLQLCHHYNLTIQQKQEFISSLIFPLANFLIKSEFTRQETQDHLYSFIHYLSQRNQQYEALHLIDYTRDAANRASRQNGDPLPIKKAMVAVPNFFDHLLHITGTSKQLTDDFWPNYWNIVYTVIAKQYRIQITKQLDYYPSRCLLTTLANLGTSPFAALELQHYLSEDAKKMLVTNCTPDNMDEEISDAAKKIVAVYINKTTPATISNAKFTDLCDGSYQAIIKLGEKKSQKLFNQIVISIQAPSTPIDPTKTLEKLYSELPESRKSQFHLAIATYIINNNIIQVEQRQKLYQTFNTAAQKDIFGKLSSRLERSKCDQFYEWYIHSPDHQHELATASLTIQTQVCRFHAMEIIESTELIPLERISDIITAVSDQLPFKLTECMKSDIIDMIVSKHPGFADPSEQDDVVINQCLRLIDITDNLASNGIPCASYYFNRIMNLVKHQPIVSSLFTDLGNNHNKNEDKLYCHLRDFHQPNLIDARDKQSPYQVIKHASEYTQQDRIMLLILMSTFRILPLRLLQLSAFFEGITIDEINKTLHNLLHIEAPITQAGLDQYNNINHLAWAITRSPGASEPTKAPRIQTQLALCYTVIQHKTPAQQLRLFQACMMQYQSNQAIFSEKYCDYGDVATYLLSSGHAIETIYLSANALWDQMMMRSPTIYRVYRIHQANSLLTQYAQQHNHHYHSRSPKYAMSLLAIVTHTLPYQRLQQYLTKLDIFHQLLHQVNGKTLFDRISSVMKSLKAHQPSRQDTQTMIQAQLMHYRQHIHANRQQVHPLHNLPNAMHQHASIDLAPMPETYRTRIPTQTHVQDTWERFYQLIHKVLSDTRLTAYHAAFERLANNTYLLSATHTATDDQISMIVTLFETFCNIINNQARIDIPASEFSQLALCPEGIASCFTTVNNILNNNIIARINRAVTDAIASMQHTYFPCIAIGQQTHIPRAMIYHLLGMPVNLDQHLFDPYIPNYTLHNVKAMAQCVYDRLTPSYLDPGLPMTIIEESELDLTDSYINETFEALLAKIINHGFIDVLCRDYPRSDTIGDALATYTTHFNTDERYQTDHFDDDAPYTPEEVKAIHKRAALIQALTGTDATTAEVMVKQASLGNCFAKPRITADAKNKLSQQLTYARLHTDSSKNPTVTHEAYQDTLDKIWSILIKDDDQTLTDEEGTLLEHVLTDLSGPALVKQAIQQHTDQINAITLSALLEPAGTNTCLLQCMATSMSHATWFFGFGFNYTMPGRFGIRHISGIEPAPNPVSVHIMNLLTNSTRINEIQQCLEMIMTLPGGLYASLFFLFNDPRFGTGILRDSIDFLQLKNIQEYDCALSVFKDMIQHGNADQKITASTFIDGRINSATENNQWYLFWRYRETQPQPESAAAFNLTRLVDNTELESSLGSALANDSNTLCAAIICMWKWSTVTLNDVVKALDSRLQKRIINQLRHYFGLEYRFFGYSDDDKREHLEKIIAQTEAQSATAASAGLFRTTGTEATSSTPSSSIATQANSSSDEDEQKGHEAAASTGLVPSRVTEATSSTPSSSSDEDYERHGYPERKGHQA